MVAGIGCRSGVSAEQVEAAIEAAMGAVEAAEAAQVPGAAGATCHPAQPTLPTDSVPTASRTLTAIATPAAKGNEPGIIAAAASRGIPLMLISQSALEAANSATLTRSEHSMAAMNVHSVAEASAVAAAAELADTAAIASSDDARAAGAGGAGGAKATPRLLGPRIAVGPVTCALADTTATALTPTSADAHAAALAANATAATPANTAPWAPADANDNTRAAAAHPTAPPVLANPTPTTP
jgi:cobalt-precorrin 5A hydrolase